MRETLNSSTYVTVQKPGRDRVLYCLVYLTRNSRGIDVFKTEAEKMDMVQRITQREHKLRQQIESAQTPDLFEDEIEAPLPQDQFADNRYEAKEYLLNWLSSEPKVIDIDCWADMLEATDLYPTDLQLGMKELVKDKLVKNIDAQIGRRTKKVIKPDWPDKSERWRLV